MIHLFRPFESIDGLAIVKRHGCRHVERGYIGCTPRSTKDFCHFSSLKSEASPHMRRVKS